MDGLVAAAGIQQETPALEYTAQDANRMFEINITGVFMTAQAVAKQMIRFGNGGSIVMIASMSGTVANRVSATSFRFWFSPYSRPTTPLFLPHRQTEQTWLMSSYLVFWPQIDLSFLFLSFIYIFRSPHR